MYVTGIRVRAESLGQHVVCLRVLSGDGIFTAWLEENEYLLKKQKKPCRQVYSHLSIYLSFLTSISIYLSS